MEDQTKILISVFSGLLGFGVIIGLSILGLRKKEKNKKDKIWNEFQKNTLLKDKVREINKQLDGMRVTVNEISEQVDGLKAHGERQDEILNELKTDLDERGEKEKKEIEEAKRLETELLKKELQQMYDESVLPKVAEMHAKLDKMTKDNEKIKQIIAVAQLIALECRATNATASKAWDCLSRNESTSNIVTGFLDSDDDEITNDDDLKILQAIISVEDENLQDLKNVRDELKKVVSPDYSKILDGLINNLKNPPSNALTTNQPDIQIT